MRKSSYIQLQMTDNAMLNLSGLPDYAHACEIVFGAYL